MAAYYATNRVKMKERMAAYYKANSDRIAPQRAKYREENREALRAGQRAYREQNSERLRERKKKFSGDNPENTKAYQDKYRRQNADVLKERRKGEYVRNKKTYEASRSRWYAENFDSDQHRAYRRAVAAARRAAKLRATPAWADLAAMRKVYEAAAYITSVAGWPCHVDHIVPLRSKLVSGLHCPANLRVLPGAENIAKGNRHWPDMPEPIK